ncbi:NADH-dependent fumarate reductase, putative [Bodo saltans]|uniref:fumarate reductase (NADH) n=1 Tax=Bodo saltans TaxID=75058 RepID=A0A0S4IK89_BODSA|nr:NADH-dependent fumarate reductase, putative [Bodo saltans]|eukprot:CUF04055.1 NADH-dependent fumarate reductase, putative [Bodo saltans]
MLRRISSRRPVVAALIGVNSWSGQTRRASSTHGETDHHSGPSAVIVSEANFAAVRDKLAREVLRENTLDERVLVVERGVEYTVPFTLKLVIDTHDASNVSTQRARGLEIVKACMLQVHEVLNCFNDASELSRINALKVGEVHTLSATMQRVLGCVRDVSERSGGAFDPACLPVIRYYRQYPSALLLPNAPQEVRELAEISSLSTGFSLDLVNGTIEKRDERAAMDFGGICKGFGVDLAVEALTAAGYTNCFVDWGGDCRGVGVNSKGKPWAVGVVRPPDVDAVADDSWKSENQSLLRVLLLENESLATSGDYENILRVEETNDGETLTKYFCSTFDRKTMKLIEVVQRDVAQVSVKSDSAMYADALATAAFAKRQFQRIRMSLDEWRDSPISVKDYLAYSRNGERLAHMHEVSKESPEMKANRIRGSFPSRVVVVGGGLAGLSAAIEAADCGASVIVLEKSSSMGGNSAKATSGINGWGTRAQALQRVHDSGKYFERDTHLSGVGGSSDPGLVRMLSVKSGDAIRFLTSLGVPLTVLSQLGGHSRKRCHRAPDKSDGTPVPIGYTIMQLLEAHIRTNLSRQVHIITDCAVEELLHENTKLPDGTDSIRVSGVAYRIAPATVVDGGGAEKKKLVQLAADAVILATGGFSNDQSATSLMREFAPHLFGRPTTNGTFATGDGVKMARSIGAQLIDMDKVQLHPTGFVDPKSPANQTKYLGPEALRGSGGILLNQHGVRFVNELDLRSVVSKAINEQKFEYPNSNGSNVAYCVLSAAAAKLFGIHALEFYWKRQGLFEFAEDVDGLAKLIGAPEDRVKASLQEYSESCRCGVCPTTGKRVFPSIVGTEGPYYVAVVTPSIHYTMGGCLISPAAEVQSRYETTSIFKHHRPIHGLFGAGEVTGGVHGRNRLGGNSLLECVVFGRIAGDRAATILQKRQEALSPVEWTVVVLREVREGIDAGIGTKVLLFNLPGASQFSGLQLGQFIAIRGEWDGATLVGYYSPTTAPDEQGVIGILVRSDKGTLKEWLNALRPGDALEMKACGGLVLHRDPNTASITLNGRAIRKLALIAGGSGVAPMLQILQAAMEKPYCDQILQITLIYAAEELSELSYRDVLEDFVKQHRAQVSVHYVIHNPPSGWIGEVGRVDTEILKSRVPRPCNDLAVVICGPPAMQRSIRQSLEDLTYEDNQVHTVDEGWSP